MVNRDGKQSSLQDILLNEPHEFLQPSPKLQQLSINLTKRLLDPLAVSSRKWRKQNGMASLHVEGFSVDQVWEQSSSLVDLLINTARLSSEQLRRTNGVKNHTVVDDDDDDEEDSYDEEEEDEDVKMEDNGVVDSEEDEDSNEEVKDEGKEQDDEVEDEDEDMDEDDGNKAVQKLKPNGSLSVGPFVRDVHGLNDAFFNIEEFNRDTEQFEDADARGMPLGSDEESIDWNADPDLIEGTDDEDGEGDDDNNDNDDDDDDEGPQDMENALYKDFFTPAQKNNRKPKKPKSKEINMANDDEEGNEDGSDEFDIGPIHRDLFGQDSKSDDDDSGSDFDDDEDNSDNEGFGAGKTKSSHSRRQAALLEEIRKLERENVAKRDWTLSGEARAAQRPMNSLLEEDLEFERAGKPVPVITQEVTDTLEEMIKRRIIAEEFDELVKRAQPRLPKDLSGRGRVELDDSKSQRSLAEIYEEEHLRAIDPENHPTTADANEQKLKKEIKSLFSDVVRKLDSLSSWHYTPKMPQPTIGVVVDAPTLEIEDAQPSAAGGGPLLGHSNIAPQEVYSAGGGPGKGKKDDENPEFVTKGGVPIARAEMTKSEKRKRRRERSKSFKTTDKPSSSSQKQQSENSAQSSSSYKDRRNELIQRLKANNVTVIGKDGERRDLEGKSVVEKLATRGASLKLM